MKHTLTPALRERFSRQMAMPQVGEDGQARLLESHAVIVGCGALGTASAERLVRAGTGRVTLIDRDIVEWSNLPRQSLFGEADAADATPKALAAAAHLQRMRADCDITPKVVHVEANNIAELIAGADCVVDGLDNFSARYLLNDACVSAGIPWVYAGVVAGQGVTMPVLPGDMPCLRCLFEDPPPPEEVDTCDTAGVLGPAVTTVAGIQTAEVLKILMGRRDLVARKLTRFDLWAGSFQSMDVSEGHRDDCPCCGLRRFDFLAGARQKQATQLCGRNAVQILPQPGQNLDLLALAARHPKTTVKSVNPHFVRLLDGDSVLTVFADGRAIAQEVRDVAHARRLYAHLVGE